MREHPQRLQLNFSIKAKVEDSRQTQLRDLCSQRNIFVVFHKVRSTLESQDFFPAIA
jgi:hypothetical protein